jgi:ferrous iron transport protein B
MNAELKSRKWFFGGIALQLGVGYSVGYLVYTVGTLIVDAASLSIPAAIGGGCFVAVFAGILTVLCIRGGKNIAAH